MNKILLLFIFLLPTTFLLAQNVHYVDMNAAGNDSGSSWANAYTDLQNAIQNANYGDQIWVAVGTYKPTTGTDRNAWFELKNGLAIYGGFIGNESNLDERDYLHNTTILSGDIGIENDSTDNSYTVVYSAGTDANTILEGFVIEKGNADDNSQTPGITTPSNSGGGIYLSAEQTDLQCQIKHCIFKNNNCYREGGALYISTQDAGTARPTIFANQFDDNSSQSLGGAYFWKGGNFENTEVIVGDSLIFNRNTANVGGAIHLTTRVNSALTVLRDCSFSENTSTQFGGAIYWRDDSDASIGHEMRGCNFLFNTSNESGGAVFFTSFQPFKYFGVKDCFFDHNESGNDGGGIYLEGEASSTEDAIISIEDSQFDWNGTVDKGAAVYSAISQGVKLECRNNSMRYNGSTGSGGGIYIGNADATIRVYDSYFFGNSAGDATGGGIHVQSDDVRIINSIFNANIAKTGAGIRMMNGAVINCVFYKNNALQQGGGIRCRQPLIANCIFTENVNFGIGPDIFNNSFPLTLESCLFSAASCEDINYNNSYISCDENSMFGIDPLFTAPEEGDFSIQGCSPAIDNGNTDALLNTETIASDYLGNNRLYGTSIDIGAIELQAPELSSAIENSGDCVSENVQSGVVSYALTNVCPPLNISFAGSEMTSEVLAGTITGVPGGTYDLSITDAEGRNITQSVTVPFIPAFEVEEEVNNPTCPGFTNGNIQLDPEGTNFNYTIDWEDGNTSFNRYSLETGAYSYTITDAQGCPQSNTINIQTPETIMPNATIQDVQCNDNTSGSISLATSGGNGGYQYNWAPNPNNISGPELTDLAAGGYLLTITDALGCQIIQPFTINNAIELELSAEITETACNQATTGSINITPLNGAADYQYEWSNDAQGAEATNLAVGVYFVTVTDANGCIATESYTINSDGPDYTFEATIENNSCFGDSTGSIDLNIEGTGGLLFTWSDNANGQTGTEINNLAAGTYYLTVNDELGCQGLNEYVISEPDEIIVEISTENASCFGFSDGSAVLNIEGGTSPYSWDGETQDLSAGTYTLTVSDNVGCSVVKNFVIEEPQALVFDAQITNNLCYGENEGAIVLDAEITAGLSFDWSENVGNQTGTSLSNLAAGIYTLTVSNEAGCESVSEYEVQESEELNVNISVNDISCPDLSNGSIDLDISGGTAPYSWTGQVENLAAGEHSITVTDASSCTTEATFTVNAPMPLSFDFEIEDATNASSTDGSINIENITGGTAPYSMQWADGPTSEDRSDLAAGMYSLVITDENDCEYSFDFTVDFTNSIADLSAVGLTASVRPNFIVQGEKVHLFLQAQQTMKTNIRVIDLAGRVINQQAVNVPTGTHSYALATETLHAGLYFVEIQLENGKSAAFKFVVH